MIRRKTSACILVFFFLVFSAQGQQVNKTGTTAAKFLSIPVGPRAIGMGEAFVSVVDDATAMYWNTSGLSRLQQYEVYAAHTKWLADIRYSYFGLAVPLKGWGTAGISVSHMTTGEMEITTEMEPEGTGQTFSAQSFAVGLSYAKSLTDWFSIGGTVKYVYEGIWNSSATGFAVDVGTLFVLPWRDVRLGVSIANFGTKMQIAGDDLLVQKDIDPNIAGNNESVNALLSTDQFDLPLLLRIGLSMDVFRFENQRLTISADGLHPNDNTESLNVGAEYAVLKETLFLRGGYNSLFKQDREEGLTLGGGLQYNSFAGDLTLRFDYSFERFKRLKDIHKFAVLLRF